MTQIDVSDRSLRVFLAVVECGSFTAAANRLGLGQPAVSHAVARLEEALGVTLLERSRTGVVSTRAGAELAGSIAPAFGAIDDAIARVSSVDDADAVTIVVSTSLAAWWLLPRLPEFKRLHPDIELRLVTADSDDSVDIGAVDLWIPLGIVTGADLEITTFCDEALLPVAAPALAERLAVRAPDDLLSAPLLHLEERYRSRFDWSRWFAHNGIDVTALAGDRSNDYSLVIQAALDGQGVALGWRHIVSGLIEAGRLVALGDFVVTEQPFTIVRSTRRRFRDGAAALLAWLVAEMAGDTEPV